MKKILILIFIFSLKFFNAFAFPIIYGGAEVEGFLKADGSIPLTANWDAGPYQIRAKSFWADISPGSTLAYLIGDGDSGLYEETDDEIILSVGSVDAITTLNTAGAISIGINTDGTPGRILEILDSNSQQLRLTTTEDLVYTDFEMGVGSMSFDTTGTTFIFKQSGIEKVRIQNGSIICFETEGPQMANIEAQAATPTIIPNRQDADTGIGHHDNDALTFVSGGVEAVRITEDTLITIDLKGAVITHGAMINNITTVNSATYDLLISDHILNVTYTSTGAVTSLTLPTAQVYTGRNLTIKDAGGNASTYNITIDTEGAEKIDGADTAVINSDYESISIYCDGTNWFIY